MSVVPLLPDSAPALSPRLLSGPAICFLTLRTAGRACLFGSVAGGLVQLSDLGRLVRAEWLRLGFGRPSLRLDSFVVMPNHLHALVEIAPRPPLPHSLAALVAGFKASCAVQINHRRGTPGGPVWQRSYDERIVRDPETLAAIRRHIEENPRRWEERRASRSR